MKDSVFPFQMNLKSFLIATFVVLVLFNLLLSIFQRIKLWDWLYFSLRDLQLDHLIAKLGGFGKAVGESLRRRFGKAVGEFLRRRKRKVGNDERRDEVEMGEMGPVTT